jgi:UDP-glucose 4-epimerase
MTVLVTGGTGFIGSYTLRALVDKGEKPTAYDLVPDPSLIGDIADKVEVVRGDILDLPNLLRTIKERDVERIIHLAYMMMDAAEANPYKGMEVNILGTNNVFEAARILDVERVVWASSAAVYGPAEEYGGTSIPVNEDSPVKVGTASVYGACKILNEFTAEFYSERYGLDLIGIRPTVIYGPGRVRGGTAFASRLIEDPARGKPVKIPYSSPQEHDWMYVKDTANAFVTACFAGKPKNIVFNVGGETRTIGEAVKYVKEFIPGADITLGDITLGWVSRYDTTRVSKELGFKPQFSLKDGIKNFISTVRQKG